MKKVLSLMVIIVSIGCGYSQSIQADNAVTYFCTLCNGTCDTIAFKKPGNCPHCGMDLKKLTIDQRRAELSEKTSVCFYLQDGVEILDFAGPMEVFSYAGFKVFTVSKTKDPIQSQGILKITPDYSLQDAPQADIIAFFGGNSSAFDDAELMAWIVAREKKSKYFFSVCTGAFALGKAGLLDGLTVTTFHKSIENLQRVVPKAKVLSGVRFVDNGRVTTTAGISAGIDGALHMVAKLRGEERAKETARYMEYDKWVPNQGLIVSK